MYRSILESLIDWKSRKRKPLVIRGARQIGKSYIIRHFGENYFDSYLEIDLEKESKILSLFESKNVLEIIKLLEVEKEINIIPGKTLIFFDEIQSSPTLFSLLRYFYEDIPELHIITAGSLLEFLLEDHDFSMPVGRIEYMFMGSMLFDEFLIAMRKDKLLKYVKDFKIGEEFNTVIHSKLINLYKKYIFLGGMPEVINDYIESNSYKNAELIKQSIIQTYQEDFVKYQKRINYPLMTSIFNKIPAGIGRKVKYSNLDQNERSKSISDILHLFEMARIIYRVYHTSANGVPLGAEINYKIFKNTFLDVGLMLSVLGLNYKDIDFMEGSSLINSGNITEQFVGQHLLYSSEDFYKPQLYYWTREKQNSAAEIDYVIMEKGIVIPIEVKAGKTGSLKSLHQFVKEKKLDFAVRINSDAPSLTNINHKLTTKEDVNYKLLSVPVYMIFELRRLINKC